MGFKTKTKVTVTHIKRKKVYVVYKWQMEPYSNNEEIIRCFTTLKKAKNWIEKFTKDMLREDMAEEIIEERKGSLFKGTKEQFFKDYHYHDFPGSSCYYILRINAYELDADYDERCWVECNPKK